MSRRILVSSNCQTGPIAAGLRLMLPYEEIIAERQPAPDQSDAIGHFAGVLRTADVWVRYFDYAGLVACPEIEAACAGKTTVQIPDIRFRAFHPDEFTARSQSSGKLIAPNVHSGILIWAYRNGVSPKDARRLFTGEIFNELGYYSCWEEDVLWLRQSFEACDLEFSRFFLNVKRSGIFMYSCGHPKANVLILLARMVAEKLGFQKQLHDPPYLINDIFAEVMAWPVYPEIGNLLSVPSGYSWTISHTRLPDLDSYIQYCYSQFDRFTSSPSDLSLVASEAWQSLFDRVLGKQVVQK